MHIPLHKNKGNRYHLVCLFIKSTYSIPCSIPCFMQHRCFVFKPLKPKKDKKYYIPQNKKLFLILKICI